MLHLAEMSSDAVPNAQIVCIQKQPSNGSAWCISYCYINSLINVQLKCSATEHFNYDPKANLSNGSSQAHAGITCLIAPPLFKHYHQAIRPHTRNVHSLSTPSDHEARGVLPQDALARTPLWSPMMKPYPSANGHRDLKQADGTILAD
ncbi:hypothetical protein O181_117632 [Austropuccinia psidii MF-1]|uniref:Uncharacterized protein n=1 Tax=Austropuccinia psidii MF-1 TaxID=1389203 RepID=A0A9Q3KBL7_9BASI|nr:hypothetical protein [Austropuccinia psidii MF-1]